MLPLGQAPLMMPHGLTSPNEILALDLPSNMHTNPNLTTQGKLGWIKGEMKGQVEVYALSHPC